MLDSELYDREFNDNTTGGRGGGELSGPAGERRPAPAGEHRPVQPVPAPGGPGGFPGGADVEESRVPAAVFQPPRVVFQPPALPPEPAAARRGGPWPPRRPRRVRETATTQPREQSRA